MGALWTVVAYAFTFGVLGLVGFALYRVLTAGRRSWREVHR
jgi:hypothetical protein